MNNNGVYLWKTPTVAGGDPELTALLLKALGVAWVSAKIAQDDIAYAPPETHRPNVSPAWVEANHGARTVAARVLADYRRSGLAPG